MASPGKAAASWRPSATLPPVSITATAASPTMKPTLAMAPALAGVITAAAPWWMNTPGAISVTGSGSGAGCAWLRAVAHASMIALARCLYGRPGIRACYTDGLVKRIATRGIRRAAHGAGRGGAAGAGAAGAAGRLGPGRPAGARWISAGQLPRADPGRSSRRPHGHHRRSRKTVARQSRRVRRRDAACAEAQESAAGDDLARQAAVQHPGQHLAARHRLRRACARHRGVSRHWSGDTQWRRSGEADRHLLSARLLDVVECR